MKRPYDLCWLLLPLLFTAGCDLEYRDEDGDSSVYVRVSDTDAADLHTVYGGVEVVDDVTGFPVPDSEVTIEIVGDGRVQDAFTVVTGPEGVARFEVGVESRYRPYDRLTFRVRQPLYRGLRDSVPIEEVSVVPDGNGFFLILYEADVVVRLSPR